MLKIIKIIHEDVVLLHGDKRFRFGFYPVNILFLSRKLGNTITDAYATKQPLESQPFLYQ